jgi:hypothetical protein
MICKGSNNASCFLEVAVFAEGGRKWVIWLPQQLCLQFVFPFVPNCSEIAGEDRRNNYHIQ